MNAEEFCQFESKRLTQLKAGVCDKVVCAVENTKQDGSFTMKTEFWKYGIPVIYTKEDWEPT